MSELWEETETYDVQQPESTPEAGLIFQGLALDQDPVAGEQVTATLDTEAAEPGDYKLEIEFSAGGETDSTEWVGNIPEAAIGTAVNLDGEFTVPDGATELTVTARAFDNAETV